MFKEIDDYAFKVSDHENKLLHYSPNVISMEPLEDLFVATEWLVKEAVKDHKLTHLRIKRRHKRLGVYSQKNLDEYDDLEIRLGSRIQGYINQLCLMEDILIFEYKRMSELVKEASGGNIKFDPETDLAGLKQRLKPIRTFRNKVIAHTAYTYSKKEDNPETIVRSILNLFPKHGDVFLGKNYYAHSPYPSQLPIVSIFQWDQEHKPIFDSWRELFISKLSWVHSQCPFHSKKACIDIARPNKMRKARKI